MLFCVVCLWETILCIGDMYVVVLHTESVPLLVSNTHDIILVRTEYVLVVCTSLYNYTLANRGGCIEGCIGCINIQYIPIHAGCIGMYPNHWRMY